MKQTLLNDIKLNAESNNLIEFVQSILWSKEQEKGDASMFCMFNEYVYKKDSANVTEIFDYTGHLIIRLSKRQVNGHVDEDFTFNFDAVLELAESLETIINAEKIINI